MQFRKNLLRVALVSTALVLGGCPSGDDEEEGIDQFVGAWKTTSGTTTTKCGDAAPTTEIDMDTVTISRGIDSPLVIINGNCTQKFDVTGNTATLRSGQSCSAMDGNVSATVNFTAGTFTVNGLTGAYSNSGTVALIINGSTFNCSITSSGMSQKVSR